ncbi:MAG: phytanoyl-CoA dioxygenase family protein [Pseudomonadota bacterium]
MKAPPAFNAPAEGRLSPETIAAFEADGFVMLRGFADKTACARLREHAVKLTEKDAPAQSQSVFSTTSNVQLSDDYFIRSGANISYFFEEEANVEGEASARLNKMGHAMHDLDPVFEAFTRTAKLKAAAASLGLDHPLIVQSMYIFKPPAIGGEVVCHQDSTYLYTDPESCIGFWFAIDPATAENGAMAFIPGAHKGPLRALNARSADGRLETRTLDPAPFAGEPVLALAEPGDLVIFHGRSPHMSAANRSARPRHAYTVHMVDARAHWPAENWLQRPADLPFRGF